MPWVRQGPSLEIWMINTCERLASWMTAVLFSCPLIRLIVHSISNAIATYGPPSSSGRPEGRESPSWESDLSSRGSSEIGCCAVGHMVIVCGLKAGSSSLNAGSVAFNDSSRRSATVLLISFAIGVAVDVPFDA